MKRFIALIISVLCALFLASCGMAEQFAQISDQIKNGIIDAAGQFIEKNTETDFSDDTDESFSESISDSDTGSDEPDLPPPEYEIYERPLIPLGNFVGFNIRKMEGNTDDYTSLEYKHKDLLGSGRFNYLLVGENDIDIPLTYFKMCATKSNVYLSYDLANVKNDGTGELNFYEYSSKVLDFASKYCAQNSYMSNVRRVEIGRSPDMKISASEYALLLNTIYDGNCKAMGETYGLTFLNREARLITGTMSSFNLTYLSELMDEIDALRDDEYLPVGGWSFDISSMGASPEVAFLNNSGLNSILNYRNTYYNGIELYLNVMGWDTVDNTSECYVSQKGDYSSEQMQAMYMLRSLLILYSMDVDNVAFSTFIDTSANGTGIIKSDGTNKVAYDVLTAFKGLTKNVYLDEIIANGENGTYIYSFTNNDGKTVYALWTADGSSTASLSLSGDVIVTSYNLDNNAYQSEAIECNGESVDFTASEMVTFVTVNE